MSLLSKFALWCEKVRLRVADVSTPYTISVKNNKCVTDVKGEIPSIVCIEGDMFEILVTDFSNKLPEQTMIDMSLKYTMDCYAFSKLYGKDIGIRIHNVKNDRDFFTIRHKEDFDRMTSALANIGHSIKQEIYYPRETVMCNTCNMKNLCRIWK